MSDFWEQFEIVGYDKPQYSGTELNAITITIIVVLFVIVLFLLFKFKNKLIDFIQKNTKSILITIIGIAVFVVVYNLFFRYDYKIINEGRKVIKIDKLTGKTTYSHPEREDK